MKGILRDPLLGAEVISFVQFNLFPQECNLSSVFIIKINLKSGSNQCCHDYMLFFSFTDSKMDKTQGFQNINEVSRFRNYHMYI